MGQTGDLTDLEITPAMIEAGVAVLAESGRLDGYEPMSGDAILVSDLFRAMSLASSG